MVHVAFVCRGAAVSRATLRAAADVVRKARCPIHVHLLVDDQAADVAATLAAALGDGAVTTHNTSDAALASQLSAEGRAWLRIFRHTKAGSFTVPKLFAFELLPLSVGRVVILDSDIFTVGDVCELDALAAAKLDTPAQPDAVLAYAHEQANEYRYELAWQHMWRAAGCQLCGTPRDNEMNCESGRKTGEQPKTHIPKATALTAIFAFSRGLVSLASTRKRSPT